MSMHKLGIAALLVFGTAACSSNSDESNISIDGADNAGLANADVEILPPNEAGGNASLPANSAGPGTQPGDPNQPIYEENEKALIPVSMQGRWGMTANDCDPKRSDNKGLMIVEADRLRFYESRAIIQRVTVNAPENFTADFAFTGEGMEWNKSENLKLTNSSKTLVRTDKDGTFRYNRCT